MNDLKRFKFKALLTPACGLYNLVQAHLVLRFVYTVLNATGETERQVQGGQ